MYNLPPTDPRLLAMTDEQIDLEWEHYKLDNPNLAKDVYSDPAYEEWERQAIEEDQRITIDSKADEWEEVELDE